MTKTRYPYRFAAAFLLLGLLGPLYSQDASVEEIRRTMKTYPFSDPGARYPFPQNVDYHYGVQSTEVGHEHVAEWYQDWRGKYLKDCNGGLMPETDYNGSSKVEAHGWSMIIVIL